MSITVLNASAYMQEVSKLEAMSTYPAGHPARYAIWQEYQAPVPGADAFHLSEWAIMPIWKALVENGWDISTPLFPCKGMKRLALISALEGLMDRGVKEATPCAFLLNAFNDIQSEDCIVGFNTQNILQALEGLISFLERNEEVFTL